MMPPIHTYPLHSCKSKFKSHQYLIFEFYFILLLLVPQSKCDSDSLSVFSEQTDEVDDNAISACNTDQLLVSNQTVDINGYTKFEYMQMDATIWTYEYEYKFSSSSKSLFSQSFTGSESSSIQLSTKSAFHEWKQREETTKPNDLSSQTHCNTHVTCPDNQVALYVSNSNIEGILTYLYILTDEILLLSLEHAPCIVTIRANQFDIHFFNTKVVVKMCSYENDTSCQRQGALYNATDQCGVTSYEGKIETYHEKRVLTYFRSYKGKMFGMKMFILNFKTKCACECIYSCRCTLGYRVWTTICKINQTYSITSKYLVVYEPLTEAIALNDTGLHEIQENAFLGLEAIKALILSRNRLQNFSQSLCKNLPNLLILKLDRNNLINIQFNAFNARCALQLAKIELQHNNLTDLPHGLFRHLINLMHLDIRANRLVHLREDLFDSILSKSLTYLFLGGNDITNLSVEIFTIDPDVLDLSSNNMTHLPEGIFNSLESLKELNLSDNNLVTLSNGLFNSISKLSILNLNNNHLTTVTEENFRSFRKLTQLFISGNEIEILSPNLFRRLTTLVVLDISKNQISVLPENLLKNTNSLGILDLSYNKLLFLPNTIHRWLSIIILHDNQLNELSRSFENCKALLYLYLSRNNLATLDADALKGTTGLTLLDLSQNNLSTLPETLLSQQTDLEIVNVSYNRINILNELTFRIFYIRNADGIEVLDLSYNHLHSLPDKLLFMQKHLSMLKICCNNLTLGTSHDRFQYLKSLKILDLSNNSIDQLPSKLFMFNNKLQSLDLSNNRLLNMPTGVFLNLKSLVYLNLSKNFLEILPSLKSQRIIQVLDLSYNRLNSIHKGTFENLTYMKLLSLAGNFLTTLDIRMLSILSNLNFLNVSGNFIQVVQSHVDRSIKLKTLDLRGNGLYGVTHFSFNSFTNTSFIVDEYPTCCFISYKENCISIQPRSEYLTCNRMLRSIFLRISVWVLALSGLFSNAIAFCLKSRKHRGNKVQSMFISNLALSDLLMGVNMLMMALSDLYYGWYFPSYSDNWRQGPLCKLAGMLSILSSEGSVFFITLISIDRMLGIKYPIGGHRLETTSARFCVGLAWFVALTVSIVPISLTSTHDQFYSMSEVCIGIPLVRRNVFTFYNESREIETAAVTAIFTASYSANTRTSGTVISTTANVDLHVRSISQVIPFIVSEIVGSRVASIYSIIVFIFLNVACFLTIAVCYVTIFINARKSASGALRSQDRKKELRMAKKMSALVLTDFFCWVPLTIVCILSQAGVITVSAELYSWTIAFILPINSSINPFLYVLFETISNHISGKNKTQKSIGRTSVTKN